jgi:hypothetical protein
MKHQSIVCFTKALLVLAGLSTYSVALAQGSKDCLRSGSQMTYTIPLVGSASDVGKIDQVQVRATNNSAAPADQHDLYTSFWSAMVSPVNGSVEITLTVPPNISKGEYNLSTVRMIFKGLNHDDADFKKPQAFNVCGEPFKWPTVGPIKEH